MNSADAGMADRRAADWWRHPWCWMVFALGSAGLAFVWARCLANGQAPVEMVQVPMLMFGVLAAGIAIWRRCASTAPAYLDGLPATGRRRVLILLAAVHGLIALAVSGLLLARLFGARLPGNVGGDLVLWVLVGPWCGWSARYLWQRANDGQALPVPWETAVLVTQGGLVALLAAGALFWGPDLADAWDSMRLFFLVLGMVAFLAAPIVAADAWLRRLAVSALIALHFTAILCVVIGAPPGPFLAQAVLQWAFRPYIDFMYLNNAYRFYSPEPSPASQLWFRIEYRQGKDTLSRWVKLPDLDDSGKPRYLSGIQTTRRLALTENVARLDEMDQVVPPLVTMENGQQKPSTLMVNRYMQTPNPVDLPIGVKQAKPLWPGGIPYHPDLPLAQNYYKPDVAGRKLLASYARHVLGQPHPQFADAVPVSVKIYRVLHRILTAQAMAQGADPHDAIYYVPYFVGQYDPEGGLMDPNDPLLYWVVPILREPNGDTKFYIYRHSGDEGKFLERAKMTGPQWIPKGSF